MLISRQEQPARWLLPGLQLLWSTPWSYSGVLHWTHWNCTSTLLWELEEAGFLLQSCDSIWWTDTVILRFVIIQQNYDLTLQFRGCYFRAHFGLAKRLDVLKTIQCLQVQTCERESHLGALKFEAQTNWSWTWSRFAEFAFFFMHTKFGPQILSWSFLPPICNPKAF